MNRGSSFSKSPREDTLKSEKIYKIFGEISKYFSESQWGKLSYLDKITCVCLKRNYNTMSNLGNGLATLPTFMRNHKGAKPTCKGNSDEASSHGTQGSKVLKKKSLILLICGLDIKKKSKKPAKKRNDPKTVAGAPDKEQAGRTKGPRGEASTSGKKHTKISGERKRKVSVWSKQLREWKNLMVYEEISDPEEED
ncbi:Protein SSX6, partial [Heterocephalus glaber]